MEIIKMKATLISKIKNKNKCQAYLIFLALSIVNKISFLKIIKKQNQINSRIIKKIKILNSKEILEPKKNYSFLILKLIIINMLNKYLILIDNFILQKLHSLIIKLQLLILKIIKKKSTSFINYNNNYLIFKNYKFKAMINSLILQNSIKKEWIIYSLLKCKNSKIIIHSIISLKYSKIYNKKLII